MPEVDGSVVVILSMMSTFTAAPAPRMFFSFRTRPGQLLRHVADRVRQHDVQAVYLNSRSADRPAVMAVADVTKDGHGQHVSAGDDQDLGCVFIVETGSIQQHDVSFPLLLTLLQFGLFFVIKRILVRILISTALHLLPHEVGDVSVGVDVLLVASLIYPEDGRSHQLVLVRDYRLVTLDEMRRHAG